MSDLFDAAASLDAGAFMAQAANEGLGVVAARNAMRESGISMSNATFSRMYGEIREAIAGRDALQGLDYGAIPPGETYTDWAVGAEGDYATFVTSYVRVPGQSDLEQRFYIYRSDQPHTPQEAIDAAADQYTNTDLTRDSLAGGVYQGSVVTSMTRTVGSA